MFPAGVPNTSTVPFEVSTLKSSPFCLLVSPLHPLKLAWQVNAQVVLHDAIYKGLPCPAASVVNGDHFPQSLALSTKNAILQTQSREALWQAQTPQFFQLGVLYAALNLAIEANVVITDEASAMEFCRKKVQLVEGSSDNIKLTTSTDLAMIEFLLKNSEG